MNEQKSTDAWTSQERQGMSAKWLCPLCRQPLQAADGSSRCADGHCFDKAKEGYINLLPVNRKRSREPGDNRDMIEARRRVHGAGLYQPLADKISSTLQDVLGEDACMLDLGCGEGYYSQCLLAAMPGVALHAVDIAKPAVRLAAKACKSAHFAVASAFDVPLAKGSLDAVLGVFAPASDAELARLIKPGGCYLKVSPGEDHLWELRQQLYDTPRPHLPAMPAIPGFAAPTTSRLRFLLDLQGGILRDVLAMTPYAYGGLREHKERLSGSSSLQTRADFLLTLYRREEDQSR